MEFDKSRAETDASPNENRCHCAANARWLHRRAASLALRCNDLLVIRFSPCHPAAIVAIRSLPAASPVELQFAKAPIFIQ